MQAFVHFRVILSLKIEYLLTPYEASETPTEIESGEYQPETRVAGTVVLRVCHFTENEQENDGQRPG